MKALADEWANALSASQHDCRNEKKPGKDGIEDRGGRDKEQQAADEATHQCSRCNKCDRDPADWTKAIPINPRTGQRRPRVERKSAS